MDQDGRKRTRVPIHVEVGVLLKGGGDTATGSQYQPYPDSLCL